MSEVEFSGVLDLSSADTKGFTPLDTGTYDFELFEWNVVGTKDKPGAKLPPGTPLLKLQFKCIEELFENRRVFDQFVIPPADYENTSARDKMNGMVVRFFVAMGMEESDVKSKKFKMVDALNALVGEPVRITLSVEPKKDSNGNVIEGEFQNSVKGYKPIGDTETAGAGRLL